jgi:arylsulfatase A-like enzyme
MVRWHIVPGFALGFLLLFSCKGVQIDRGPFPIEPDHEMIAGKEGYLRQLSPVDQGDSVPNIVVILVDDLGKFDFSVYEPQGVPTPSLEKLAGDGILFTSAYSTSSVCSPSRAALLTGRYQHRFGFERQPMSRYPHGKFEYWFVDHFVNTAPMQLISPGSLPSNEEIEKQGIPSGEILLSEILSRRGYETGIFGKWHLGSGEPFIPNHRGFGEQYGFYEAFTLYDQENDPGIVNFHHHSFANKHIWRQQRRGPCAITVNDSVVNEKEYLTFSIASRACRFIEQNRQRPFFLYVPFNAPHTPFQAPLEYVEQFSGVDDQNKQVYYAMISALDDAVGSIMEKLEEEGLLDRTLIFFASDNGGATYTGATDNGILKAGKFSQFEGGINIPMIVSWQGVLPGGVAYHEPVSLMDIFTTVLSVTGSDVPGDRKIDGIDLMPHLLGWSPESPHQQLFWRTDYNKTIRQGAYKLVWNARDQQTFLYDLENDPSEQEDLSARYPDLTRKLKDSILDWEKEMKAPLWPGVMEFRFDIDGQVTWWAI